MASNSVTTASISYMLKYDDKVKTFLHEVFFQDNKDIEINDEYYKTSIYSLMLDALCDFRQSIAIEENVDILQSLVAAEDFSDCACSCKLNEQKILSHFQRVLSTYIHSVPFKITNERIFADQMKHLGLNIIIEKDEREESDIWFHNVCYSILFGVAVSTVFILYSKRK